MKPSVEKVLRILREGPTSTGGFMEHYVGRAPARIGELRRLGCSISKRPVHKSRPNGPQVYTLDHEPPGLLDPGSAPSKPADLRPPVAEGAGPAAPQLFDTIDIDIPAPSGSAYDPEAEWIA